MITHKPLSRLGDSRPSQPASPFVRTIGRWDVAIGVAYARIANRRLARLVGRILVALAMTELLVAKWQAVSPLLTTGHPLAQTWNAGAFMLDNALQIPFLALSTLLVVLRTPQIRGTTRFSGVLVALGGTLFPTLLVYDSTKGSNTALVPVAVLFLAAGMIWAIWSLSVLGRCFGVVPEVRGLVTRGPYRWVRHPIYLGEVTATFGVLLPILSVFHVAVFVVFCGLQLWRTGYEEVGLSASFPEYGEYRDSTARLVPGLW